jgi:hypothetical protein
MKFDANRMAKLAGLFGQETSNMLTEAGNRSMHDDPAVQDDADHRFGKGQLSEDDGGEDPEEGAHAHDDMASMEEMDHAEEGMDYAEEGMHYEGDEDDDEEGVDEALPAIVGMIGRAAASPAGREFVKGAAYSAGGAAANRALSENADVVYDIDEDMLREELQKMRQERDQRLNESKVRNVVRDEIIDMLNEMSEEDLNSDSSWLYGDNKPTRSKNGQVTVGALGIGFE